MQGSLHLLGEKLLTINQFFGLDANRLGQIQTGNLWRYKNRSVKMEKGASSPPRVAYGVGLPRREFVFKLPGTMPR